MARFYFKNQCVFKISLLEINEDFDAKLIEIVDYLAETLNVNKKLITFQLGESHGMWKEEKKAC